MVEQTHPYKRLLKPLHRAILNNYKILMIKMKISYIAWEQGIEVAELFIKAINLTIRQQETEITSKLKNFDKKFNQLKKEEARIRQMQREMKAKKDLSQKFLNVPVSEKGKMGLDLAKVEEQVNRKTMQV